MTYDSIKFPSMYNSNTSPMSESKSSSVSTSNDNKTRKIGATLKIWNFYSCQCLMCITKKSRWLNEG